MSMLAAFADSAELLVELRALGELLLESALLRQRTGGEPDAARPAAVLRAERTLLARQSVDIDTQLVTRWSELDERMDATREQGVFIPWIHVVQLFQLDREEQCVLLAALLCEMEVEFRAALPVLAPRGGEAAGSAVPLAALVSLLGADARGGVLQRTLDAEAALRQWQLIEFTSGAHPASSTGGLQLTPVIAAYLQGSGAPQPRLESTLPAVQAHYELTDHLVSPAALERLRHFVARCGPEQPRQMSYLLHLQGSDASVLESLGAATLAHWGLACVRLDGRQVWRTFLGLQRNRVELSARLRAVCRDALLTNRVLMISHVQWLVSADAAGGSGLDDLFESVFATLLESQRYCVVLNGPAARLGEFAHRYAVHPAIPVLVRCEPPDAALRLRIWQRVTREHGLALEPSWLERLVNSYQLTEEQIRIAMKDAISKVMLGAAATLSLAELIVAACRDRTDTEQLAIAKEVRTPFRLGDIVLAPTTLARLQEILHFVQHRHQVIEQWGFNAIQPHGKNLCVLFHGPSGTGKTMAASIVANELGQGLFKVDLASVLSKYIGETEKHLAQLFDQAEAMNVVLFFDEAESLFAKRTETRDAHDRYANLQTGYLLQRVETHPGVVILSTNLLKNLDKAFARRFKFMLEFPFPGIAERRQLWQKAFPPALPRCADVDCALLAERVSLSGGHINNIAVRAAFQAAAEQQPLALRHVLAAVEREYEQLGKVFATAEFAWEEDDA